jgi:hypothetical protein
VGDPEFDGARVHVGCLGPVSQLTIQCIPDYDIRVTVYHHVPCAHFIEHFRAMLASCDSFSLYHDFNHEDWRQQTGSLWLRVRVPVGTEWVEPPSTWFGKGALHGTGPTGLVDPRGGLGPSRMANRMHRWSTGLWAEALSPTALRSDQVSGATPTHARIMHCANSFVKP